MGSGFFRITLFGKLFALPAPINQAGFPLLFVFRRIAYWSTGHPTHVPGKTKGAIAKCVSMHFATAPFVLSTGCTPQFNSGIAKLPNKEEDDSALILIG